MALSIGELVGYVGLDTDAAEKGVSHLDKLFGSASSGWGKLLAGGGAAAGVAFGASLFGAMDLQPGRAKIAASLDLTQKQADRAGKVAGQVYANGWGDSADEVNDALEAVMSSIKGMRTASSKDLQATTQDALAFATVMGVDVSRAAQVAGNMVRNGMAKNGRQAFDLLTKASSRVPKELREDVLDATDEYGQFFNAVGIKGPQAMALLQRGAAKGMYGIDKTGDAIKEFTIRSTDMSSTTKQAYHAIGLDAHTMANDVLAGGTKANKAFNKIVDGVLSIKDPTKRSNTAIKLFGTQMEDMGVKDVPKFLRSLKTSGKGMDGWRGATKRAGDTLSNTASNNLETFKRGLQVGFVSMIGGKVLPAVTKWTGALNHGLGPALDVTGAAVKGVAGFLDQHHSAAIALVAVIVSLTVVTMAYNAVMAVSAAGGMINWLKATKLVTSATKIMTAVQWAMNAALAANPIVLITVAIIAAIAVIVLLATKTKWGHAIVVAAWNGIKAAASAVGHFFSSTLPSWFSKAWDKITAGARNVGGFFSKTVPGFFSKAWSKITNAVSTGAGKVVGFLRKWGPTILAVLAGPIGLVVLLFVKNWSRIHDAVTNGAAKVVGFVKSIPGRILRGLGALDHLLWNAGSAVIQGLIDGITSKVKALTSKLHAITSLIPKHKGPIDKDRKLLKPAGKAIMQGLLDGLDSMQGKLLDKLHSITSKIAATKDAMAQQASAIADNFRSDAFSGDLSGFDTTVATDTANADAFHKALAQAVGKGLSGDLLKSLAESGNLALAQQFAALTKADIAAREKAYGVRNKAALGAGTLVGDALYAGQLKTQTSLLRGIHRELQKLREVTAKVRQGNVHLHQQKGETDAEFAERVLRTTRKRG